MDSFSRGFTALRGDINGFSSTPRSKTVKRLSRNRRFNQHPIKMEADSCSSLAHQVAEKEWRSCLVYNSISQISLPEQSSEADSEQYWATNELETESLDELSYSDIEINMEIIQERNIWLREEEHKKFESSSDEEQDFSRSQRFNEQLSDISFISEDGNYARIDDENIPTTDDTKYHSLIEKEVLSSEEEQCIFVSDEKNNLNQEQMQWIEVS